MAKSKNPILVIDDEKAVGGFFVDLFKLFDTGIDVARTGRDGLKKFKDQEYALVFLDYKLGDMVGTDVLAEIKMIRKKSPVVLISGYLTDDVIKTLKRLGAEGYLYKPLSADKILAYARKYVDKKKFKIS